MYLKWIRWQIASRKFLCGETTRHSSGDEDCTCIKEDGSSDSDSDVEGATTYLDVDVPHTIVFKCIGASRDSQSQASLQTARGVIASGGTVPVRMRPEPTNIVDSRAIVFEHEIEKKWKTIGYVVTDILDHVHVAISSGSINFCQWILSVFGMSHIGQSQALAITLELV